MFFEDLLPHKTAGLHIWWQQYHPYQKTFVCSPCWYYWY